jgi:hypothetical protein
MKRLTLALAIALAATPALACAPIPSCWLKSDPAYLKSVCHSYSEIDASYVDEPEKVPAFVAACKRRFNINVHVAHAGINMPPRFLGEWCVVDENRAGETTLTRGACKGEDGQIMTVTGGGYDDGRVETCTLLDASPQARDGEYRMKFRCTDDSGKPIAETTDEVFHLDGGGRLIIDEAETLRVKNVKP